jgi:hypothetical protein
VRYRKPLPRRIAPRLASGESRIPAGNGLPPILKHAISVIAEEERQSRSWVIEQILLHWAQSDPRLSRMLRGAVDYLPRKTPEPESKAKAS